MHPTHDTKGEMPFKGNGEEERALHLGEESFTHTPKKGRAESGDYGTREESTREESLHQVAVNPTFLGLGSSLDRGSA